MAETDTSTKRALIICISSLFVLLLADRAGAFLCSQLLGLSENRYVSLYEGRAEADIVVVGNSRADSHFPPRYISEKLGHKLLNYGIGGVSTVVAETLVRDHIDRNGKPKLIVLEASSLTVDPDSLGDMRLFSIYSDRMKGLVRHSQPDFARAGQALRLFQYNTEMFFRLVAGTLREPQDRLHFDEILDAVVEVSRNAPPWSLESFPRNSEALRALSHYCRQNSIEFRVIISPWLPEYRAHLLNLPEFKAEIEEALGPDQFISDYSTFLPEHKNFEDANHLNAQGAFNLFELMRKDGVYDGVQMIGK